MKNEPVIRVQNVSKDFGQERVLHSVSRDFASGQIHGIVGNNGSGKTVLMKCICGFLFPTEGRVLVNGKEVGRDMDFPPNLGIIIETPGFLPGLTGVKNLELLASLRGKIGLREIADSIRRVGLEEREDGAVCGEEQCNVVLRGVHLGNELVAVRAVLLAPHHDERDMLSRRERLRLRESVVARPLGLGAIAVEPPGRDGGLTARLHKRRIRRCGLRHSR